MSSQRTTKRTIAFIGCGTMGAAMAGHLIDAGYDLRVYNRTAEKCVPLVAQGAKQAKDVTSAVKGADVVITMVGTPSDVEDLYLSHDGILEVSAPGAYLIDMTTSSPQLARDISEVAELSGKHAFDAPVTGGPEGAAAATLTIFCGTDDKTLSGVRDVLECMGSRIACFGGAGKGQLAKLANQTALAGAMVGFAEAFAFAKQAGLDVAQTLDALSGGMGDSKAMATFGPKVLAGDFKPGFTVDHYVKDIDLIERAAESMELTLPGVDTARDLYNVLSVIGAGKLGTQAITLMYEDEDTCARHGLDWSRLGSSEYADDEAAAGNSAGAPSMPSPDRVGQAGSAVGLNRPHVTDDDEDDDYEEFDVAGAYGLESFYDAAASHE